MILYLKEFHKKEYTGESCPYCQLGDVVESNSGKYCEDCRRNLPSGKI